VILRGVPTEHGLPAVASLEYAPPQVPRIRESLPPGRAAAWAAAYGAAVLPGMILIAAADVFWYTAPELPGSRYMDFIWELPPVLVVSAVAALIVFFQLRRPIYQAMRGVKHHPLIAASMVGCAQVAIALAAFDARRFLPPPTSAVLVLIVCCGFPVLAGMWLGRRSQ
jgi:hypothetical protein